MPTNDPDGSRVLDAIAALRLARLLFHEAPQNSPAAEAAATEIEWRLADVQRAVRVLDRTVIRASEPLRQTLTVELDTRRNRTH
jgi:hypothetical protein